MIIVGWRVLAFMVVAALALCAGSVVVGGAVVLAWAGDQRAECAELRAEAAELNSMSGKSRDGVLCALGRGCPR